MAKRTAYLHVGLPRSGGSFLGAALVQHADALEAQGLRSPARSVEEMFRAAIEIRRDHQAWGYRRREVEGAWAGVFRRAREGKGDVVVSQELLAACAPEQIALLLDGLSGFEVHVVVTARDLGTQLVAAWAGSLESGRSVSFGRFRERVTDPAREHDQARSFWAGQELDEVLARWSAAVRGPQRVHVIVAPADADDPQAAVWSALGDLVGFDATALPLTRRSSTGPDAPGVALLRTINRAVDGRLTGRVHRETVPPLLSAALDVDDVVPAAVPDDLRGLLLEHGERWRKALAEGGYDVLGDSAALLPRAADPRAVAPDEVGPELRLARATEALAHALVEVARLREHHRLLEERTVELERKRKKLKRKLARTA